MVHTWYNIVQYQASLILYNICERSAEQGAARAMSPGPLENPVVDTLGIEPLPAIKKRQLWHVPVVQWFGIGSVNGGVSDVLRQISFHQTSDLLMKVIEIWWWWWPSGDSDVILWWSYSSDGDYMVVVMMWSYGDVDGDVSIWRGVSDISQFRLYNLDWARWMEE